MQDDHSRRGEAVIKAYSTRLQNRRVTGGNLEWATSHRLGADLDMFLALDDAKARDLQVAEQVAHDSIVRFARSEAAPDALIDLLAGSPPKGDAPNPRDAVAHLVASLSILHYEDQAFPLFQLPACWLIAARAQNGADLGGALFPLLLRSGDDVPHVLLDASRGFRETALSLQTITAEIIVEYAGSIGLTGETEGKVAGLLSLIGAAQPGS